MTVKPYPAYKASGVAWIGDLPWDWGTALQLRHLAACLDSRRIPLNSAERADMPGDVPYWGSGGVVGSVGRPLFDEELVLLGEDGAPFYDRSRPVSFRVEGPTWVNNHIHVLRPRKHINPVFLVYALNSVDYSLYISGSTRDKLTQDDMWSIRVPVPPLTQQRQIANYLDAHTAKIDKLIDKQEQLIETLAERRQAVISHAVTKGLDPNAPMKDSGIEGLERIPAHWVSTSVRHLVLRGSSSVKPGPFGSSLTASDMTEADVKVYNQRSVLSGNPSEGLERVSIQKFELLSSFDTGPGDILLTTRGTIGRAMQLPAEAERGLLHPCLIRIRPDFTKILASYLLRLFNETELLKRQFVLLSNATTIEVIYSGTLRECRLAVPPTTAEQAAIEAYLKPRIALIDALSVKSREMIDVLKERRQALISAAVTGKIDVRGLA